jgi:hypothetical protein
MNTVSSGKDMMIAKLDSNLNQIFVIQWDSLGLDEKANDVCIDPLTGDIYVTGYVTISSGNKNIVTAKYNSSGTLQWRVYTAGNANLDDEGNSIAFDGTNVWVVGYTSISGKGKDGQMLKLNGSTGAAIWQPKRNGTSNTDDVLSKVCLSGTSAFVTGYTSNTSTNKDIFVACLSLTTSAMTWSISINGTSSGDDGGWDALYNLGDLYICGYTNNSTTNDDYYFARINVATGAIKYNDVYDGGSNGTDQATSMVSNKYGFYGVTGFITDGSSNNFYNTRMYDTSNVYWTHSQPINGAYTSIKPRISTDTIAYEYYISGVYYNSTLDGLLYQVDNTGTKRWAQYHDGVNSARDIFVDLVVDGLARIFVVSPNETTTSNIYDYKIIRYSQTPVYMPVNYNMAADTFSYGHLFYPNSGEIVDTARAAVPEVLFYTKFADPVEFIQKNRISFCHYKNDTDKVSPTDTISRIDMWFNGANEFSEIFAADFQNTAKLNYFLDYTGSNGLTNVKGASHLICPNIYPMIDLHYSSNVNGAKYYFVVKPTGDPASIQLYFDGAISTSTVSGNLRVVSYLDSFEFKNPDVYNVSVPSFTNLTITTTSVTGNARWVAMGSDTYSIDPGTYNSAWPLIIEFDRGKIATPSNIQNIKWSTYIGSGGNDYVWETKCDVDNNLFAVGETFATNFPGAIGSYQTFFGGGSDGFVAKFDTIGQLLWSTYVGGTRTDYLKDLDFSSSKDIYCVGSTNSQSLPLQTPSGGYSQGYVGPYEPGYGVHFDGLIFVIGQDGLTNPWLTYYAGNSDDYFYGCKVDLSDNFFVVGASKSTNLPVSGAAGTYTSNLNRVNYPFYCDTCYFDGYIVKFNSSSARDWSTYIGSDTIINAPNLDNPNDALFDICLEDPSDAPPQDVYVTGHAGCSNYPTMVNGGSTNYNHKGREDVVVTHFTNAGQMVYSSYFGSSYNDYGNAITHKSGKLYITGIAADLDFQTDSSGMYYFQRHKGLNDAYFIIMNGSTDVVQHSSYLGGTNNEAGTDIVVDNNNIIYMTGVTSSSNFPMPPSQPANTYNQTYKGNNDNYVCAVEFSNKELDWSTYLGGTNYEANIAEPRHSTICIDGRNNLFLGGMTSSDSAAKFPLDNGGGFPTFFEPVRKGFVDGTITKFDLIPLLTIGIKENQLSLDGVFLYPNPTNGTLNIKLNEGMKNMQYRIFDVSGKLVGYGKLFSTFNTISVNNLSAGMYFIEIFDNKNRASTKFVKYD